MASNNKISRIKEVGARGIAKAAYRRATFAIRDSATFVRANLGESITPYLGFVGYNNLGDEILFDAHRKLFPELNLVHYGGGRLILKESRAGGLPMFRQAVLGGGTLIDHSDNWIRPVEKLISLGTRMFCLGTGVEDPSFMAWKSNDDVRERWVSALSEFDFVGVRGPLSRDVLKQAGLSNVEITGDTAMSLAPDRTERHVEPGLVGICYGDAASNHMWGDRATYREEMANTILALIEQGKRVELLPVWDIDIPSNMALLHAVSSPKCTMNKAFGSFHNYVRAVQQCEYFIGQKLHASVIAVLSRVPVIMLEYNPKCRDFMASLGLEKYVIKTSEYTADDCLQMASHLSDDCSLLEGPIDDQIRQYKSRQHYWARKLVGLYAK
jgi:hypothetical protein